MLWNKKTIIMLLIAFILGILVGGMVAQYGSARFTSQPLPIAENIADNSCDAHEDCRYYPRFMCLEGECVPENYYYKRTNPPGGES